MNRRRLLLLVLLAGVLALSLGAGLLLIGSATSQANPSTNGIVRPIDASGLAFAAPRLYRPQSPLDMLRRWFGL